MANTRKRKDEDNPVQEQAPNEIFPFTRLDRNVREKIIKLLSPFDAKAAEVSRDFYAIMNTLNFWRQHFMKYFPLFIAELLEKNGKSFSEKFGFLYLTQKRSLGKQNSYFINARNGNTAAIVKKFKFKNLESTDENKDSLLDIAAQLNLTPIQTKAYRIGQKRYLKKPFNLDEQNIISFAVSCREPVEKLANLVTEGHEVDPQIDSESRSATHIAVEYGYDKHLQFLLDNGAQVDRAYKECWTPLGLASFYNRIECAIVLLKFNPDINYQNGNKRQTALHLAAFFSYLEMLALLIQSGANLEEINYDGKTPLEVALTNNNIDAAIMLIEAGASMHRENDTISPFMTAITLGNPRLVQAMINKGALEYINRNRDPRSAIMCIMSNNLDIMSALLVNDMTTSYPLARVTPIIQNALVKRCQP